MERETTTITIGTHTFKVKTYATAREVATIQGVYFKGAKFQVVGDQPKIDEFNPGIQFDVQLELIRQMVVAMDDIETSIVERAEALPNEEFQELTAAIDALTSKKKK